MRKYADAHWKDIQFKEGDWVYVLQPYRQESVATRQSQKLSKRFFDHFEIIKKIGSAVYEIKLPDNSKIYNVFHVSLLEKYLANTQLKHLSFQQQWDIINELLYQWLS